jgi:hypothetical protein
MLQSFSGELVPNRSQREAEIEVKVSRLVEGGEAKMPWMAIWLAGHEPSPRKRKTGRSSMSLLDESISYRS